MWKPIVNEQFEKKHINNKINEIYVILLKKMRETNRFDLYMGKAGFFLFCSYYQTLSNECQNDFESSIISLVDNAGQYEIANYKELTFYAELVWLLCHLYEKKQINIDFDGYFSDIDNFLYDGMVLLLNEKEYGCVNGAISIALGFYYRYILGDIECKKYLELFVDILKKISIEKDNTIEWISVIDYGTYEQGYNLGIAHGIPGVLLFLRKLYLQNIKKDLVSDIIIKATNFLLLQKHSLETNKSFFYNICSSSSGSGHDTRLGWCYGDMSVGYSLYNISCLEGLERNDVKEIALEILLNTTLRTHLADIGIVDAGLCHGATSVAHIYNRLYHHTNELKFKKAALYWYKESIKMAKYEKGYAGYKLPYYLGESEKKLCELHNLSLLTGVAGIGLALLSAIYPIEPSWDMCLLLS